MTTEHTNIVAKVQALESLCSRSGTPCASGLVEIINRLRDENRQLRDQLADATVDESELHRAVDAVAYSKPEDKRDPNCVEAWPDCWTGGYDPRCCRFPKSCSADVYEVPGKQP